jgi:hypothetical protein
MIGQQEMLGIVCMEAAEGPKVQPTEFCGFNHERLQGNDEWLTPLQIIKSLGKFDLDPCTPISPPWLTAEHRYHKLQNGLLQRWFGRVWLNPPYGTETGQWLGRLAEHGNGTALIFARTETEYFFDHVWNKATALLFIKGRIQFYKVTGEQGGTAGAPSVLIAYGKENAEVLKAAEIEGAFVPLERDSI